LWDVPGSTPVTAFGHFLHATVAAHFLHATVAALGINPPAAAGISDELCAPAPSDLVV